MTEKDIKELIGVWKGFFSYGQEYPPEIRKERVSFTINIRFADGVITGTCRDKYTDEYFDRPATIDGTIKNNEIIFIKKYPGLLRFDENWNSVIMPDEPSFGILYRGSFSRGWFSKKIYIKGHWEISGTLLDETNTSRHFINTGKWKMEKVFE